MLTDTARADLITLAVWAAGEYAKEQLGLPSEWDQRTWCDPDHCGSPACIGGKYMYLHGFTPTRMDGCPIWVKADQFSTIHVRVGMTGEYVADQLGILDRESGSGHQLFDYDNSFGDVMRIMRELLDENEPLADWERDLLDADPDNDLPF